MLISFSMIVLNSQLVIAVADQAPKFDIARSCKLIAVAATSVSEKQPIERCNTDEQQAQQQLERQWSTFPAANRAQCSRMEAIGDTPSYVSLLTCLQMDQMAK
jgi:hypothetical protein